MERIQTQVLSKVSHDDLQSVSKKMVEKSYINQQLSQLVGRHQVEQLIQSKVDASEFHLKMNQLNQRLGVQRDQDSNHIFSKLQQIMTDKIQTIKYEVLDVVNDSTQKLEGHLDEKFFNFERQYRSHNHNDQKQSATGLNELQARFEARIDELKQLTNNIQTRIIQVEKSEVAKSTDAIQNCLNQVSEFESRTHNFETTYNERLQEVYKQQNQMKIDIQKQMVKLEGDLKREFSQKLTANIDQLEKRVEDTIFQNKEAQCQIEENIEKITTTLEHLNKEVQGKEDKTSSNIAEQATKTYDKMLQYIEQLKLDQKAELERTLSELKVTDKAEKGQIHD